MALFFQRVNDRQTEFSDHLEIGQAVHPQAHIVIVAHEQQLGQRRAHLAHTRGGPCLCQADESAVSDGGEDQGAEEAFMGQCRESFFRQFWKPSPV